MTAPIETVNITIACQILGVSRPTVTDYIARGMPVVSRGGKGQEWKLNPVAILRWKAEVSGQLPGNGSKESYESARARKVTVEADLKGIQLAIARREYVSVELVESAWAEIFSNVKTRMMAITPRVAPIIPSFDGDILEIESLLNKEIRGVLRALAESAHIPVQEEIPEDE